MLQITEIKIRPYNQGKLRAFVQGIVNGFRLTGLKVIEGTNGLFVSYPAEKGKDGKYYDVFHPVNGLDRGFLNNAILDEYVAKTA